MRILLIGTGGTIAGIQKNGIIDDYDYTSGVLKANELLNSISISAISHILSKDDEIIPLEFCNLNSDDMTYEIMSSLSNTINSSSTFDGIVITHGTDTLEETSFFLEYTTNHKIPVVMTCAMYPATSPKADGPSNLLFSLEYLSQCIKTKDESISKEKNNSYEIVIAFNQKIIPAKNLIKAYINNEYTFENSVPSFADLSAWDKHYEVNTNTPIQYVPIAYFGANAPSSILYFYAKNGAKAIILAGAGAGEYSEEWIDAVENLSKKGITFIRTSKIRKAPVNKNQRLSINTLNGGSLSPEKASILTSLHLI